MVFFLKKTASVLRDGYGAHIRARFYIQYARHNLKLLVYSHLLIIKYVYSVQR